MPGSFTAEGLVDLARHAEAATPHADIQSSSVHGVRFGIIAGTILHRMLRMHSQGIMLKTVKRDVANEHGTSLSITIRKMIAGDHPELTIS